MRTELLKRYLYAVFVGLSFFFTLPPHHAVAADTYWICGYGGDFWDNSLCWDSGLQPADGDNAFLNSSGATVTYQSTTNPTLNYVEVSESLPFYGAYLSQAQDTLTTNYMTVIGYGRYDISGTGSLVVNNNLTLAGNGLAGGSVSQDGGSVSISGGLGALVMDGGASYYLHNGALTLVGSEEYIGVNDSAYFDQSGGTHEINGMMYLGVQSTGYGTYGMYNGTLTAGAGGGGIVLGEWGGTGDFYHSGTSTVVVNNLTLGRQTGARGTYDLAGGNLTTDYVTIGNDGTGTFWQRGGTNTVNVNMTLGANLGSSGTYNFTGGTLNDTAIIGDAGTGLFNNSGGTHNVTGDLILGNQATGNGTYNLSGTGSVSVSGNTIVGNSGTGTFNQSGGVNTTGTLVLGVNAGSSGTYNFIGGTLNDSAIIGDAGTGFFNNSGGTHNVTGDLILGNQATGAGTYNLSGTGSLAVSGTAIVGNQGTGTFNQSGGTHTTRWLTVGNDGTGTYTQTGGATTVGGLFPDHGTLRLGNASTGVGAYNLQGGNLTFLGNEEFIGELGTGYFNQSGGVHEFNGKMYLGVQATGYGEYNMTGGTLQQGAVVDGIVLGEWGGTGVFNQSGGTVNVFDLTVGRQVSSTGTYNLSDGILSTEWQTIGNDGTGTFNQSGGTNTLTYNLSLGQTAAGNGTYNLSGTGSLAVSGSTIVGNSGTGTFNQTGGTNNVANTLTIAANTGSSGIYNFSGGTLTAANITNNDTLNYSGGNLNADVANNASFNISGGGTRTINGNVTNNAGATVKTTGTTAVFTGTFTNLGAYISDPSSNYFTDLTVGTTGYLVGGVGDNFFISNDFINNSTQNALWDTVNAYLEFTTGVDALHDFYLTGLDYGVSSAGYTNNFSWGTLELTNGNNLNLFGSALYVNNLILGTGSTLALNGINLYYNTFTNYGGTYFGGNLVNMAQAPVPEPSTLLLLGSGLAGVAVLRKRFKR